MRGKGRKPLADRLSGERIQHQIDSATPRRFEHLVGERHPARIHDVGNAESAQEISLLGTSGGGEDLGPREPRNLQRREPDAARGGVDENPISRSHRAEVVKGIPRREKGHRKRDRLFRRQPARPPHHSASVHGEMRREATGPHRQHVVPFAPSADPRPHGDDSSRAFVAEKEIFVAENRVDGERLHHVAEVDGRRCDLDLDLAASGTTSAQAAQREALEGAGRRDLHAICGWLRLRGGPAVRAKHSPPGSRSARDLAKRFRPQHLPTGARQGGS